MPKYYLQRPDGSVSDIGSFPQKPTDRDDGAWVEGVPTNQPKYAPKGAQQLISESYAQLSKELRTKLRPFTTDGFVALASNNLVALADIIADAETQAGSGPERNFITQVKRVLGVSQ